MSDNAKGSHESPLDLHCVAKQYLLESRLAGGSRSERVAAESLDNRADQLISEFAASASFDDFVTLIVEMVEQAESPGDINAIAFGPLYDYDLSKMTGREYRILIEAGLENFVRVRSDWREIAERHDRSGRRK